MTATATRTAMTAMLADQYAGCRQARRARSTVTLADACTFAATPEEWCPGCQGEEIP